VDTTRTATFLPLTTQAAAGACASGFMRTVHETETAADACWNALLAGCDSAGRWGLDDRLRQLYDATSKFVGREWWFTGGSVYRLRVAQAQADIEEAVADGDGQEFARAFVGYDHAVASAVVCGQQTRGAPHRE
jgi:hypothetical protein